MNIIDFLLLLVIAVSVAFAVYRGSVASLLGLAACLGSLVIALYAGPLLARVLGGNQGVTDLLTTYSDAGSQVGDYALATTQVNTMREATLEAVSKSVHLPDSIERILHQNLAARVFTSAGMRTVNEYITATIVSVLLEAGSFVIAFLLCCLALHMVINLISHVYDFPVLTHFDGLLAAVFGLLRGMLILYVLFLLVPLLRTIIPLDILDRYIDQSTLTPLFASDSFFTRIIGGM